MGKRIDKVYCGSYFTAILYENGAFSIQGDFSEDFKNEILWGKRAKQLACGQDHVVVLFENGTVCVIGKNNLLKKTIESLNIRDAV